MSNATKNIFASIFIGLVILVVISATYGLWLLGKTINYKLSYQSMVQTEIRAMVKPEALK